MVLVSNLIFYVLKFLLSILKWRDTGMRKFINPSTIMPELFINSGRECLGMNPGSDAGRFMNPGSDAGMFMNPGSDAGRFMNPGSVAGIVMIPGRDAGRFLNPGSDAGMFMNPGSDAGIFYESWQ